MTDAPSAVPRTNTICAQAPCYFLRLPAELRNTIYRDIISWNEEPRLLDQPAITRVSRQFRAEALPLYYGIGVNLRVKNTSSSSGDWGDAVRRILDAFTGGADLLPSGYPSTLRYVGGLQLDFLTREPGAGGVHISVDLMSDPKDVMPQDPGDPCEVVMVGCPNMDWTDPLVVRAACDEAALRLEHNLAERLVGVDEDVELIPTSTTADQRAAVNAMCVFALACPHLTSVCICDTSAVKEADPSPLGLLSIEDILEIIRANEVADAFAHEQTDLL